MDGSINVQGIISTASTPLGTIVFIGWSGGICRAGQTVLTLAVAFGLTADHLAADNQVIAVEPNPEMIRYRLCNHPYRQIAGGLSAGGDSREQLRLDPVPTMSRSILTIDQRYSSSSTGSSSPVEAFPSSSTIRPEDHAKSGL